MEVAKLNAIAKKSECKVKCLEQQLDQIVQENQQMSRLWEDLNTMQNDQTFGSETLASSVSSTHTYGS